MERETIKAIILDVDGVLTDGRLWFSEAGHPMQAFHVHDGTAIKRWHQHGKQMALLSGRQSPVVRRRSEELGIETIVQGAADKLLAFEQLVRSWALSPRQVCYVGDDTPDVAPMRACGFAIAVANAVPEVKAAARFVTEKPGGWGAVREVVDLLLDLDAKS